MLRRLFFQWGYLSLADQDVFLPVLTLQQYLPQWYTKIQWLGKVKLRISLIFFPQSFNVTSEARIFSDSIKGVEGSIDTLKYMCWLLLLLLLPFCMQNAEIPRQRCFHGVYHLDLYSQYLALLIAKSMLACDFQPRSANSKVMRILAKDLNIELNSWMHVQASHAPRCQCLHTADKKPCFFHADYSGRTTDVTNISFVASLD